MKDLIRTCIVAYVLTLVPAAAVAQNRTPTPDSAAVGGELGLFLPAQNGLESGIDLFGFYEYYTTSRTSFRLGLEWMNPEHDGESDRSERIIRIGGDVVRNWEGGAIHPFAGAGLGVYIIQPRDEGRNNGDSEGRFGGNIFGGLEIFLNRTTSFKAEARYHVVSDVNGFDPDGLALTVGVKTYF